MHDDLRDVRGKDKLHKFQVCYMSPLNHIPRCWRTIWPARWLELHHTPKNRYSIITAVAAARRERGAAPYQQQQQCHSRNVLHDVAAGDDDQVRRTFQCSSTHTARFRHVAEADSCTCTLSIVVSLLRLRIWPNKHSHGSSGSSRAATAAAAAAYWAAHGAHLEDVNSVKICLCCCCCHAAVRNREHN